MYEIVSGMYVMVVFHQVCLKPRSKASDFQDFDKYNVFSSADIFRSALFVYVGSLSAEFLHIRPIIKFTFLPAKT